jgi:hypothetical protein
MAIPCAARLATSAGSLAEHGNITLKEHDNISLAETCGQWLAGDAAHVLSG